MVMMDPKTERLLEFSSTAEFDLKTVNSKVGTSKENKIKNRKFCNKDLPLLLDHMTPCQFEQIEIYHERMLRLEQEAIARAKQELGKRKSEYVLEKSQFVLEERNLGLYETECSGKITAAWQKKSSDYENSEPLYFHSDNLEVSDID